MATTLQSLRKFIPETGDNRQKEKSEQIVAWIRNVDIATRQKQIRKFIKMKSDQLMEQLMEDAQATEIKDILIKNVVKFDNFMYQEYDNEGNPKGDPRPIKMEDLIAAGEIAICMELFMNILNASQLSKEQVKNSDSQSGTTVLSDLPVLEGTSVQ